MSYVGWRGEGLRGGMCLFKRFRDTSHALSHKPLLTSSAQLERSIKRSLMKHADARNTTFVQNGKITTPSFTASEATTSKLPIHSSIKDKTFPMQSHSVAASTAAVSPVENRLLLCLHGP